MKTIIFTSVLALVATQGLAGNQATPNAPAPSQAAGHSALAGLSGVSGFPGSISFVRIYDNAGFFGGAASVINGTPPMGGLNGIVPTTASISTAIVTTGVVVNGVHQTVDTNTGAVLTTDTNGDGIADAP